MAPDARYILAVRSQIHASSSWATAGRVLAGLRTIGVINVGVFVVAACVAGLVSAAPVVAGSSGPDGRLATVLVSQTLQGRIIFSRAGGSYGDDVVFFANADGSGQRRLTRFGVSSCCARISRDGQWVLFSAPAAGERVTTAVIQPSGSGYRLIPLPDKTLNLGPGAWSPDGKRIAFQVWDNSNHRRDGIYIGRATDGADLKRVTTAKVGADIPGDFSPDGKRLVFFRERPDAQSVGSVWVVNLDGTHLKRLTPDTLLAGWSGVRWSPDGTKILFAEAHNQPQGALWTVRPDGSHLTKLFQDENGRYPITPTWSPTGAQIMFALDPTSDDFSHPANGLYVINANGTGLRRVIGGRNFKREPDWVR